MENSVRSSEQNLYLLILIFANTLSILDFKLSDKDTKKVHLCKWFKVYKGKVWNYCFLLLIQNQGATFQKNTS